MARPAPRQKRSEDNAVRQQAASTPLADAIIVGTAVGGLVAGINQVHAGEPQTESVAAPIDLLTEDHEAPAPKTTADEPSQTAVPVDAAAAPSVPEATAAALVDQPVALPADAAPALAETVASVPDAALLPSTQDAAVQQVAERIAETVAQVAQGAASGIDQNTLAQDIVAAAQDIVAQFQPLNGSGRLDPMLAATAAAGVGEDTLSTAAELLGDLSDVAASALAAGQTVIADVSDIAETVLDAVRPDVLVGDVATPILETVDSLLGNVTNTTTLLDGLAPTLLGAADPAAAKDLPASLLGFEGSDIPGGLLSDLFYDDGASDAGLGLAASSLVSDLTGSLPMLGQGYGDPDMPGHNLNALSLL